MAGARPIQAPTVGGSALARRWAEAAGERLPWLYRAEAAGLAAAVVGLAALLALILWLGQRREPPAPPPIPVEITMADQTGLTAAAPPSRQAPAPAAAPEQGHAAPAAPPPPAPAARIAPAPEPPAPAPPSPSPSPAPRHTAPQPRTAPQPAREAPASQPRPSAQPRSAPAAPSAPDAPTTPRQRAAPARPTAAAPSRAVPPAARAGTGNAPGATASRARASRLGSEISLGQSDRAAPVTAPPAQAQMTGQARQNIGMLIQRQVQPCANRQVNPGPGAERIRVVVNLRIARDGSLVGAPRIVSHDGVDDDNRLYVGPMDRNAVATFVGCAPLRGLPAELYDVPGGWSSFTLRYSLPR